MQRKMERQQKEQMDQLHKLLETSEQRLVESNKNVNRLTQELESAARMNKQFEKKSSELSKENQRLKMQLEASVRVTNPTASSLAQSLSARNGIALADELHRTKAALERVTKELQQTRASECDLTVRAKILSDALEFRMEEIGLSGHADLLAKVAALRGEVQALRDELGFKREELETAETEKMDNSQKQESLQRQISLMQLRLTQSQEELKKLNLGDLPAQLKSAQQERDVLLEFVEGDMQKSSVLARQIEKLESEARVAEHKLQLSGEQIRSLEANLEREITRSRALDVNSHSLEIMVAELSGLLNSSANEGDSVRGNIAKLQFENEELASTNAALNAEVISSRYSY
jgi:chromosome segregation ATPase